jgi:hypothetical protein
MRLDRGRITASTSEGDGIRHLFILRVENGRGAYAYAPSLTTTGSLDQPVPSMDASLPSDG